MLKYLITITAECIFNTNLVPHKEYMIPANLS